MNQYNYLELFCDNLPEAFAKCGPSVFMQGCGPCHTTRSVFEWLKNFKLNFFNDWLGNILNFNPFKNPSQW